MVQVASTNQKIKSFFSVLTIEPRAFMLSCISCLFFFYFETGSCKVTKLPRLGSNLSSSCLSLWECWDYRQCITMRKSKEKNLKCFSQA